MLGVLANGLEERGALIVFFLVVDGAVVLVRAALSERIGLLEEEDALYYS
jgi:hypothetical protein